MFVKELMDTIIKSLEIGRSKYQGLFKDEVLFKVMKLETASQMEKEACKESKFLGLYEKSIYILAYSTDL